MFLFLLFLFSGPSNFSPCNLTIYWTYFQISTPPTILVGYDTVTFVYICTVLFEQINDDDDDDDDDDDVYLYLFR